MSEHAMRPVDAAWYHMDGPANRAIVTAVALTHEPLDFKKVRAAFSRRLLRFERFRQRVVESGVLIATPHWEDVPEVDLDWHLRLAALPAPHDEAALRSLVDELASTPLDRTRPLWQAHVVERVGSGSALVLRYHHCIGDGTAMMTVAAHLFETTQPPRPHGHRTAPPDAPPDLADQAVALLRGAGSLVSELVKWPDPASPFKGHFGTAKRVAWSHPVALADVKAVGEPTGAKINDVLVAATAGALRAYLAQRDVDVAHTTLRAMVPVDLRAPQNVGELGNEFGLVILDLPVSSADAAQRLALTKERMDALKHSTEAQAMRLLFEIFGRGPKALEDVASQVFGSKTSLVMTNVAGPREPVRLAGATIDRMMFCVPHPGEQLGLGVSIFSYHGAATLTVVADARLVPDPQAITQLFDREFAAMLRAASKPAAPAARRAPPR